MTDFNEERRVFWAAGFFEVFMGNTCATELRLVSNWRTTKPPRTSRIILKVGGRWASHFWLFWSLPDDSGTGMKTTWTIDIHKRLSGRVSHLKKLTKLTTHCSSLFRKITNSTKMIHAVHPVKHGEEKGQVELRKLTETTYQFTRETTCGFQAKNYENDRRNERRRAN